jgi:hypothetical protein
MSSLLTQTEEESRSPLAPTEIFRINAARENVLSRLLMLYISTGLFFMLLPGTFLGVWNLLAISSGHAATIVMPTWIQAHGHAQIFGWVGTFILGIGFYSLPKLRHAHPFEMSVAWATWGLWTAGVTLRWLTNIYRWHWRVLLPLSAALELAAFLIFFGTISGHRPQESGKQKLEEWILVVIAGSIGLLLALLVNLGATLFLARSGTSPEVPTSFDQRFLVLQTWGFLVPFVWGFSAKWLPTFLGLGPIKNRVLLLAVALNSLGVLAAFTNRPRVAAIFLLAGMTFAVHALGLFELPARSAKVRGAHSSFPAFVRIAYIWALVGAGLGIWAASVIRPQGIWGASRHALTAGFLATMVFAIGQRVIPAFAGRLLFSTKLMLMSLLLLTAGCLLRVSAQILAYQGFFRSAWSWLPISAVAEMTAVTVFAINLIGSFARRPPPARV